MSNRIMFNAWGRGDWCKPKYAIQKEGVPASYCVAEAIARASGLEIIFGRVCDDGVHFQGRRITARQYRFNLGSQVNGGGWYPEAEIKFTIPVDEPLTTENIRKGRRERSDYRGTRLDY